MSRNLYSKNEIILCTYIARFGNSEIDEYDVYKLQNRSLSSIKMKIQNIASMLDEKGHKTESSIPKLTGMKSGQKGRRTNWDIVQNYTNLNQDEFRSKCNLILDSKS